MALNEILDAARDDILETLGLREGSNGWSVCVEALDARTFAKVLFLARRAELIACAEGRGDELVVQAEALKELEGKAPKMCAALVDSLTGGSHLVKARLRQLEEDQAKVLRAAAELRGYEQQLGQRALALASGDKPRVLSSGTPRTEPAPPPDDVVEGELEPEPYTAEDAPDPPELDLPRDPHAAADAEIELENERRKTHPDKYRF